MRRQPDSFASHGACRLSASKRSQRCHSILPWLAHAILLGLSTLLLLMSRRSCDSRHFNGTFHFPSRLQAQLDTDWESDIITSSSIAMFRSMSLVGTWQGSYAIACAATQGIWRWLPGVAADDALHSYGRLPLQDRLRRAVDCAIDSTKEEIPVSDQLHIGTLLCIHKFGIEMSPLQITLG